MRVMGIDPGTRITGYGCVELTANAIEPRLIEAGVLKLDSAGSIEQRLMVLHEGVVGLIDELQPGSFAIEKIFAHYKHPRTAITMAHARGVVLLAAQQAGLGIEHLPATEVKKSVTGNGHATKHQIQQAVASQCRLAELPEPPDVADAIAIALCAARRQAFARLAQRRP